MRSLLRSLCGRRRSPAVSSVPVPRWGGGTGPQIVASPHLTPKFSRPPNLAVILINVVNWFSQKISKFDATRCQILTQNAQNSISAGAPPPTHWGAYSAPRDSVAVFKGPTSEWRRKKGEREEGKRRVSEGKRRWGGRKGQAPKNLA